MVHLWNADFRVPFTYALGGDALGAAARSKGMIESGWIYSTPLLAAPFGQQNYDFPLVAFLHVTIQRVLQLVVRDPFVALNLLYVLACPLNAIAALYAMRRLGVAPGAAFVPAVLFANLYEFYRRELGHVYIATYYVVPIVALGLLLIARGDALFTFERRRVKLTADGIVVLIGALLVGLDSIYNTFFALLLLPVALALAAARSHSWWRPLVAGAGWLVAAGAAFIVNAFPSLAYGWSHGPNEDVARLTRNLADVNVYALSVAGSVLPIPDHRLASLAAIRAFFEHTWPPTVTENEMGTLGIVATIGLVLLLASLVVRTARVVRPDIESAALLVIWAILVATINGLGTLVNYYVFSPLRAYNRISLFIAFFCLFAVAAAIERGWALARQRKRPGAFTAALALLLVLGVLDQTPRGVILPIAASAAQFEADGRFVRAVETALPAGSAVLELPFVPYPLAPRAGELDTQRELLGYLHSDRLSWTFGAIDGRASATIEQSLSRSPDIASLAHAAYGGINGVVVFREAYPDHGAGIEHDLHLLTGASPLPSPDNRESLFVLTKLSHEAAARRGGLGGRAALTAAYKLVPTWGTGWYVEETDGAGHRWRWGHGRDVVHVENLTPQAQPGRLAAFASIAAGRAATITLRLGDQERTVSVAGSGPLESAFVFPPGRSDVTIETHLPDVQVGADARQLNLQLEDLALTSDDAAFERDLARIGTVMGASEPIAEEAAGAARLDWLGCYGKEVSHGAIMRWCEHQGTVVVHGRPGAHDEFSATVLTPGRTDSATAVAASSGFVTSFRQSGAGVAVRVPVKLDEKGEARISITNDAQPLVAAGDPRQLVFLVRAYRIVPQRSARR